VKDIQPAQALSETNKREFMNPAPLYHLMVLEKLVRGARRRLYTGMFFIGCFGAGIGTGSFAVSYYKQRQVEVYSIISATDALDTIDAKIYANQPKAEVREKSRISKVMIKKKRKRYHRRKNYHRRYHKKKGSSGRSMTKSYAQGSARRDKDKKPLCTSPACVYFE
jgi:hypothetical protein